MSVLQPTRNNLEMLIDFGTVKKVIGELIIVRIVLPYRLRFDRRCISIVINLYE